MGETRLYALIGNPVSHSRSPFIMDRAFRAVGLAAVYIAIPVPSDGLDAAVDGLGVMRAGGANVTYPYKEGAVGYVDALDVGAELVGAVNTLVWSDDGVYGYNTDAPGVAAALERFGGVNLDGVRAFVFGAGGAARAAALGLLVGGARGVTLAARSPKRAEAALSRIRAAYPDRGVDVVGMGEPQLGRRRNAFAGANVVINATPVGMETRAGTVDGSLVEDESWIDPAQCYVDFVYGPRRTAFLDMAATGGARALDGVALLVCQASESFRLWTGSGFDIGDMISAVRAFDESEDIP